MEDNILSPGSIMSIIPPESAMDFDYMDQLLLDGCWIDTTNTFQQSPSDSTTFFDYSYLWSSLDSNKGELSTNLIQNENLEESVSNEDRNLVKFHSPTQNMVGDIGCTFEASEEVGKRWWIGPRSNLGPSSSVMERLIRALGYIRDSAKDKDTLIQIWVPVIKDNRHVLTTNDQPFSLNPDSSRLARYRDISVNYQFSAEKDSLTDTVGLPGRVFLDKVPEWTPDVRFFRSDEYSRVDYAQQYGVRGTLALPIFERGKRTCLGVIEVVTTTQKSNYSPEFESVCKALEAVDLSSSKDVKTQDVKVRKDSFQVALPEILEVLKSACVTHRLPLAQTWVPCIQQGKEGCRHSEENYMHCVSTVDQACYIADPHVRGFQEACSEHHLLKGQGIAGRAFTTNQPCFSSDITSFSKTEYPLSHHARMFGLRAAVAIRFRSIHTGLVDYVLEFFLPADCLGPEEQKKTLSSLSIIIQETCRSLRVVTNKELEEETAASSSISELIVPLESGNSKKESCNVDSLLEQEKSRERLSEGDTQKGCSFGESSSSFMVVGKSGEKRRTKADKAITLEVLQQYFAGSLKNAAKNLGVCPTTLKRICRQQGIKRWPSRKIKKVGHSLEKLQRVIDSVQGTSGTIQIGSFYSNFPELANVTTGNPKTNNSNNDPTPSLLHKQGDASKSPSSSSSSSSCSHNSSSSSHSCSSETQALNSNSLKDVRVEEGMLKRDAEIHVSRQEELKIDGRRVKVTYGEEKIRFRMQKNWKLKDLMEEVGRRFNVSSEFHIKYLDDDSEWVLLTCDADLDECLEVCQSSESDTMKLSLHISHH